LLDPKLVDPGSMLVHMALIVALHHPDALLRFCQEEHPALKWNKLQQV